MNHFGKLCNFEHFVALSAVQYRYGALSFSCAGNFASIFCMIFSAIVMPLAIADSTPGHGLSNCASLRAAKIVAQIHRTRLRPSSTRKA
jgi:hypothetical protein